MDIRDMKKIGPKILFNVEPAVLVRLDRIADDNKFTRAEAARRMLETGIDIYEEYEKVGVPQFAQMVKRAMRMAKEKGLAIATGGEHSS